MTSPLPGINDRATLRVTGEDTSYTTQVKGVEEGQLVLAAPKVTATVFAALEETSLELEWSSARGLLTAPVRWVGSYRGQGSLWQLEICGEITTSQRRSYVRAPLSIPGQVHVGAEDKAGVPDLSTATTLEATVLDLSESGLRLILPHGGLCTHLLRVGRVIVEITLSGETLLLPGEVLNVVPLVPPGGDTVAVVVILDDPGPIGTKLRKAVLQAQVEARRAWA